MLAGAAGILAAVLVLAVGGRPYDDTKGRFRIELAEKWELVPQFGDMSGMTFRRVLKTRRGEAPAILMIHMDSTPASDPKEYADLVETDLKRQPGFAKLEEKAAMVGGKPALVREYRMLASKKPKIEKSVRAYFLEAGGHLYQLHFESTVSEAKRVEKDVTDMVASFVPLGGGADKKKGDADLEAGPAHIAGRWINADELVMVLGDDGSFALAEASGRYEVKGDTLTMIIPGQGRESFTFVYDAGQGTLTLNSTNLDAPMVYRRVAGASAAKKEKSEKSEKALDLGALRGKWRTPTPSGPLDLDLRADKTFTMGSMHGEWSAAQDRLTLKRSPKESIEYRVRIDSGKLMLSGGDLEEEVAFSRLESP